MNSDHLGKICLEKCLHVRKEIYMLEVVIADLMFIIDTNFEFEQERKFSCYF